MTLFFKYLEKLPLSFIILLLILPIGNKIYAQCGSCDDPILIPNHDFQMFDANCIANETNGGQVAFFKGCVEDWDNFSGASTADLYGPDFVKPLSGSALVQEYFTSEVAAIDRFAVSPDGIVNNSIMFPSAPNVSYNISLDIAGANFEYTQGVAQIVDFDGGALEIQIDDFNTISYPIDNSFEIAEGFKTICIEDIIPSELDSDLSLTIVCNPINPNGIFYIDNISMNCEIENANLNIQDEKTSDLQYAFDLTQDNPNLYTTIVESIEWDFGDENTSNELNPQHTYNMPGIYTVTALIKDEFGCCTTLSKQIIVTEGCGSITLTGTSQINDLEVALGTSDFINAIGIVEVNGILEIDENVIFGENLNFLLTSGSNIVVNSNNLMEKNGGYIGPCDTKFDGVIVNNGATLSLEGVRLWGAERAIELRQNSVLNSTNCVIQDSRFGIYIDGEGDIPTFEGNRIENCNLGIYADNTFELNIESPSTNFFNDCYHGISYRGTAGSIKNCHFNDCQFGIVLGQSPMESTINDNIIYASEVGISLSDHLRKVWIGNNNIGQGGKTPRIGISVGNSGIVANDNVAINATWRAVSAHNPTHFTVWNNENINVIDDNTGDNDYSSGIYLSNPLGVRLISTNTINGNMNSNITCISCTETTIGANTLSGATGHGISLEGGSGSAIGSTQILNQPWKGIGLYGHNGGEIQENLIRATWNGLLVHNLSQTQIIKCNDFIKGTRDIETRSVLSPQFHRKNVFRIEGSQAFTNDLNFEEVNNSRFIVEECPTDELVDKCYHPEQWELPGLFQVLTEDPDLPFTCLYISGGIPPSNPGPEDEYWCWLFSHIEVTQSTDPLKSWVQRYKALKLISIKYKDEVPENCIPYNEFYCDMDEFIAIESAVKDMIENVINSTDNYEVLENGVTNRIADLDALDCTNDIFILHRDIYKSVLKDMIRRELSTSELQQVRETAELCAYTYGDVVYWARGILDNRGEIEVYDDEQCENREEATPRNSPQLVNDQIIVSPNPTSNYISLENKTNFDVLDLSLTDSYGKVYKVPNKLEEQLNIDCTLFSSGVYFITFTHSSGYRTVKRIVVTN